MLSEQNINNVSSDKTVNRLFLDLNSFFASCEQQERPELRGRPIAVVQMMADSACAIGMSQEKLGLALTPPMTRVSIANIEAGNQRVLPHTLTDIAAILKSDITDIFPKKIKMSIPLASVKITEELVSKLGITKAEAKKLLGEKTSTT